MKALLEETFNNKIWGDQRGVTVKRESKVQCVNNLASREPELQAPRVKLQSQFNTF